MTTRLSEAAPAVALLIAVFGVGLGGGQAQADPIHVLVPAYFYPTGGGVGDDWGRLASAASTVPVDAILNPNSGPGLSVDPNYASAVDLVRGAGGHVFGYVHTTYSNVPLATVEGQVNTYISQYHLDGFFVDEMDNTAAHLAYYQALYGYIKGKSPSYRVIGNPGTNTLESYLTAADTLVTFEGSAASYESYVPSAWTSLHSRDHFANLIHTSSLANLNHELDLALSRNAGSVFVTDRGLPNPYDGLPSYWDQEVAAIARTPTPEPASAVLLGMGAALSLVGVATRRALGRRKPQR